MLSKPILRRLVLLGTPLATAVVMLFHPAPYSDLAGELVPIAGWWTTIHAIQFVLFAFMGAAVWMLTDGLRGAAAAISRMAAVVFAISYDIGDAVAGISTGSLDGRAAGASAAEQAALIGGAEALFQSPVKNLAFAVGINAWDVALIAAAVALFFAGAPRVPLFLLALPVYFVSFDHAFPFGALTFGSFFVAALWLELARPKPVPGKGETYPDASEAETG